MSSSPKVINCVGDYKNTTGTEEECKKNYADIPFELSPFQKYSVEGMVNGDNVLVIAHTGSGKTLPAKILLKYITQNKGKKMVYTSPIKALSNQKFRDLQKEFPEISFGLITGDTKFNPDADCLIMTTEILRNTLVKMQMIEHGVLDATKTDLDFELDIQNDLGAVVFDEVHYINNNERGTVWAETIMMLPTQCQLLMLSASLDAPGSFKQSMEFAKWVTKKGKNVWICSTEERVVPLTHFSYMVMKDSDERKITNKAHLHEMKNLLGKPMLLKKQGGKFQESNYQKISRTQKFLEKYRVKVSPHYVINNTVEMIKNNKELPALFFVFSRKMCEEYARKITIPLFDEGSKNPSIIEKMCEKIIMSKIGNWREYLQLPEYRNLVSVLKKGIAYHHSSVPQVLREMVEILFEKGDFIKVVFVTETFAVGINMPVKTVVFPKLNKFDGNKFRQLLPHEYTQMAGRAGRRNLDVRGTIYHLSNLIDEREKILAVDYAKIMSSMPPRMTSKFSIEPRLVLELIAHMSEESEESEETNKSNKSNVKSEDDKLAHFNKHLKENVIEKITQFVNKSRLKDEIDAEIKELESLIIPLRERINFEKNKILEDCGKIDAIAFEDYRNLYHSVNYNGDTLEGNMSAFFHKNNLAKKKKMEKIHPEFLLCHDYLNALYEKEKIEKDINNKKNYINMVIQINLIYLIDNEFVTQEEKDAKTYISLLPKGIVSTLLHEINSLPLADLFIQKRFNVFSSKEIAVILSCFADAKIPEYYTIFSVKNTNLSKKMKKIINDMEHNIVLCENDLNGRNIEVKNRCDIQYNLCDLVNEWYDLSNVKDCLILLKTASEYEITLGIWCKAIMKICNMARELEKICAYQGNLELMSKLKKIPDMLLKSVVNNQSLYV